MTAMGGTNDISGSRPATSPGWRALLAAAAGRGLAGTRRLLAAVDGHEGARRNAARAVAGAVARAHERAEAARALDL